MKSPAQLLTRLVVPTRGRPALDDTHLNTLPLALSGRRIGYVGPTSYLFSPSVRDNLLLGLGHHPRDTAHYGAATTARRKRAIEEARRSGNSSLNIAADWVDYQQAEVTNTAALESRIVEVLRLVDLEEDVYLFGRRGRVDPDIQPEITQRIVEARRILADRPSCDDLEHLVERLASDRYNANSPVAANLLFGTPIGSIFEGEGLACNAYVQSVRDQVGLTGDLVEFGAQLARIKVELLAGLRSEHEFFEELGLISTEDLPVLEKILTRKEKNGVEGLVPEERARFVSLAFKVVAARDPLGLVDEGLQQRVLRARRAFAENLPTGSKGSVEFFDPDRYNTATSV